MRSTPHPRESLGLPKPQTRAARNIKWIEDWCRVPEGARVGEPIRLREWQRADLVRIYDNPHGTRQAIISFGKKNGKTSLAACLLLLHLCGPEAIPNTQLPSTAQSIEQAGVLFRLAAKIVRLHPDLTKAVIVRDTLKQLFCPELGTLYRALSADATTAHGLSPVFCVHDELGQVRGPRSELYTAIENAMGAHDAPMSIIISTQAPTDGDLLSMLIDDALAAHDPSIVVSLYTADPALDPFSEEAMRAANPALGDFLNIKEIRKQAETARRMPAQEALYRNYNLNQRVAPEGHFISPAVWALNGGVPDIAAFERCPVFVGADLSATQDLTAIVAVAVDDDVHHVRAWFFLPEQGLAERAARDRVPYDLWAEQGYLITIPGTVIDEDVVARTVAPELAEMDVQAFAYDRWQFESLRKAFARIGYMPPFLEDFGQGFKTMTPALKATETVLLDGRARHGNHPVLTMCASNVRVVIDDAGNRKLTKRRSTGKIDGLVGFAMAEGAIAAHAEAPVFDVRAMIA